MRDHEHTKASEVEQEKAITKMNSPSQIIETTSCESKSRILSLPSLCICPPKIDNASEALVGGDAIHNYCTEMKRKVFPYVAK